MARLAYIMLRLILTGAFMAPFLGWLGIVPLPIVSPDLEGTIPAFPQSLILFVGLGIIAWLSLRLWFRRKITSGLLAVFAFAMAWSLSVFAVRLP